MIWWEVKWMRSKFDFEKSKSLGERRSDGRGNSMQENRVEAKKKRINRIDSKIIGLLQKDGRVSNTAIARELGISESTVRTRLKRLIKDEVIQIVAVSNPLKLGFGIVGVMNIQADIKKVDNVIEELKRLKEVWYIVLTTGTTDINVEFNLESWDELHVLLFEKIAKIDGIIRTDTSLIMNFVKRQYEWGTAPRSQV
jgi:Lrp/AsnC family transcriptional regulator for asnA, asnC and gidA